MNEAFQEKLVFSTRLVHYRMFSNKFLNVVRTQNAVTVSLRLYASALRQQQPSSVFAQFARILPMIENLVRLMPVIFCY